MAQDVVDLDREDASSQLEVHAFAEWWRETDPERKAAVAHRTALEIRTQQSFMNYQFDIYHRMYRQRAGVIYGAPTSQDGPSVRSRLNVAPLSLNLIKAGVSTVHSRIWKERNRIMFLADGGTFGQRESAKMHQRFSDAVSYQVNLHRVEKQAGLNSLIFGTGIVKTCTTGKRPDAYSVLPSLFVVDDVATSSPPRAYYEFHLVSRDKLRALYGKDKKKLEAINRAQSVAAHGEEQEWALLSTQTSGSWGELYQDKVCMVESYVPPTHDGAKNGYYIKALENCALEEGAWNEPAPYHFLRWSEDPVNFWGIGIAEEGIGIQLELNRLVRAIQRNHRVLGKPYVLADRQSNLVKGHMTNVDATIIQYTGREPRIATFTTSNPEVYDQVDRLYARWWDLIGVSADDAAGRAAPQHESGRSQLVARDTGSLRFAIHSQDKEDFHKSIIMGLYREARREGGGMSVKAVGPDYHEVIKASDLDTDLDSYIIRAHPTSILPETPAGKMQAVEQLVNILSTSGVKLDGASIAAAFDHPTIDSMVKRQTAPVTLIERMIAKALEKGEPIMIDTYVPLELFQRSLQMAYIEGLVDQVPPERLDLLRVALDQVLGQLKKRADDQAALMAQEQAAMAQAQGQIPVQ